MMALECFSPFSGYRLNLSKSELFPINGAAKNYSFSAYPFTVAPDKLNFTPLLDQTTISLEKWSKLPISLIGRLKASSKLFLSILRIFF